MAPALSPEDRAVVDQAVVEILDGPRPRDRGPLGCALAMPGFLVLLVMPVVVRRFGLGDAVGQASLWVGLAFLIVGLVMYFTAGGFVRGHYSAAAEAGLRGLEAWSGEGGDREEALRGATLVLLNAMAAYGATSTLSFDPAEARRRIGPSLMPLVESVEEHLVAEGSIYRVFTEWPDDEDGGGPPGAPGGPDPQDPRITGSDSPTRPGPPGRS